MITRHDASAEEFEKYRLVVDFRDDCTLQTVHDSSSNLTRVQTWNRKKELGDGAFSEVWQEESKDEYGDWQYRAVKRIGSPRCFFRVQGMFSPAHLFAQTDVPLYSGLFVKFYGWWEASGNISIAMEYLRLGDLSQYAVVGLQEAEIKQIAKDIAEGLEVMHRYGFTHRDIKPQNILVVQKRPESPFWSVKVSDFGHSKKILSASNTALHTLVGTQDYCAPEILHQLQSDDKYNNKVDMWSLGCVLFNLASKGQTPFSPPDLVRYCDQTIGFNAHNLPLNVQNDGTSLIKSLLNPQPRLRPSANDLLQHRWLSATKTAGFSVLLDGAPAMSSQRNIGQNFNSFLNSTLSTQGSPKRNKTEPSTPATTTTDHTRVGSGSSEGAYSDTMMNPRELESTLPSSSVLSSLLKEREADQNPAAVKRKSSQVPKSPDKQSVNPQKEAGSFRASAVHKAALNGQLKVIQWLVERGAAIDTVDKRGWTPLYCAAYNGHFEVFEWLIERGAAIPVGEKERDGWTLLTAAAFNGHLEVVKFLVERGAAIDAKKEGGWTPLYLAAQHGHLDVVKFLLDRGASLTIGNDDDFQPLHIAAQQGHPEVVRELLERGVAVDVRNSYDWTPLTSAAYGGHLKVVKFLIECGATVNMTDTDGWTPLDYAAYYGHLEVVKWLVERGDNVHAKDDHEEIAQGVSERHKRSQVAGSSKEKDETPVKREENERQVDRQTREEEAQRQTKPKSASTLSRLFKRN